MQKLLRIFITTIAWMLFVACLVHTSYNKYQHPVMALPLPTPHVPDTLCFHQLTAEEKKFVAGELDYYLQRHDVQDEGYTTIADFAQLTANGQMTSPHAECHDSLLFVIAMGGHWHQFHWHCGLPSAGEGIGWDRYERLTSISIDADTIMTGFRPDKNGIYQGEMNKRLQANGHGIFTDTDGRYYEGHWENDIRDGFGFAVGPESEMKAGQWKQNVFKGERLTYNAAHIYGIDISRYQHGKGKAHYPILWDQLRITYLGRKTHQQTVGEVDYPVSFMYIKSTEGTNIVNPHYAADYQQARKHGIPCGAYHFFSTKSTASEQAAHFLKSTQFRRGDFPPVLDIEPTQRQIDAMGGTEAMLKAVRTWLKIVERKVGVKPILYVGQNFVKKYLSDAKDIKEKYTFWIARYGEYMPDVKLVWWQLSQDGRVSGITGDVDINIFNGYRTRFDDFMRTERID